MYSQLGRLAHRRQPHCMGMLLTSHRMTSLLKVLPLNRKKALTPILAGSICGGLMVLAWVIGFAIYFRKRYNRKKRNRLIAEGKAVPREKDLQPLQEKVVIPPDPAVLLGQRKPGEMVFPERQHSKDGHRPPWSRHASRSPSTTPQVTRETGQKGNQSEILRKKDAFNEAEEMMTVPSNV